MKIAFLSRHQKVLRGAEVVVFELSQRLSKKHQVDLLVGNDADNLGKVLQGKYDLVIPVNGRWQSLQTSLGRVLGRYKILITGHSGIGRDDIWNIVITRPDIFVALTDYMAEWARKWAWGSKVVKISNGVDLERFSPEGDLFKVDLPSPIILSVGALTWYKHHEKVINAVSKLDIGSLLIVGRGPEETRLQKLINEKLVGRGKIINASYQDMPNVYRAANLFTLPSWDREAFGLVYLEAMATNLPVITPNDPPRKEIIGEAGILVNVDNNEEYAAAINKALEVKWNDIPRKRAEKFNWDKVADEYNQVIQDLFKP